jgi:hypothetical protein
LHGQRAWRPPSTDSKARRCCASRSMGMHFRWRSEIAYTSGFLFLCHSCCCRVQIGPRSSCFMRGVG